MTKLKLDVGYNLKDPEGKEPEELSKARAELTKSYIEYAFTGCYKDGLTSKERRLYANIISAINIALLNKNYEIELGVAEIVFLKETFANDRTKFPATVSEYVVVLEDEILQCTNKK